MPLVAGIPRIRPTTWPGSAGRLLRRTNPRVLLQQRGFDAPPILIGGCGRSGTTMLLAMLAAHPRIAAIPFETNLFARLLPEPFPAVSHRIACLRASLLVARQPHKPRARRWCEKTPGNVHALHRILDRFDDVRFVHIVRDGRDVVTSSHPMRPGPWVPVRRWVEDVSAGLRFEDDPRVYTVRYEDLVTEYEPTMRALLDWLGEPFSPEMRAYHEHTTVRRSNAWRSGARSVDARSVGRHEDPAHADHVSALLADPEAVALLERLGYGG